MVENKKIIGSTEISDRFQCKICFLSFSEEEGRIGKVGMICDNCDEEPDQENNDFSENTPLKVDKENISISTPFNTFTNEKEKDSKKTIELSVKDIEKLNNEVKIPAELNVVDCLDYPDIINPNKEWFRTQFKNFWRLFNSDSEWVFIIHDRGTGKSKQTAIHELYHIAMNKDYEGCFIMRNRDEPTRQTKEYFSKIIREFDETIWQGERPHKGSFFLQWNAIWKGVQYKSNPAEKKGDLKCHFLDLFSPEQARTLINKPIKTVFFDECVPTRNQIKEGKGWKVDEPGKYMEAMKSLGRLRKPKKIFTGNPNDSWRECWMIVKHFSEELINFEKWYWKNRPNNLDDWLNWTWTIEWVKGNMRLQLKKIATSREDFENYEEGNWDNFLEPAENLKIRDYINSNEPMYFFNNCLLAYNKGNKHDNTPTYYLFTNPKNPKISQRDKKTFPNLVEYYSTHEQRMRSKQRVKRFRTKEELQKKFLKWYEQDKLFFGETDSKRIMEEFIGKGKTVSEF